MRDYAKVAPTFWTGKTGRALRGNRDVQVVALYLMTSPHASMTGLYHCPVVYIAHDTGLSPDAASSALAALIDAGFCTYDEEDELVFVHEMARFQIGEELKPGDNRTKGVQRELDKVPDGPVKGAFITKYKALYHIDVAQGQAPSKPLQSQEQAQAQATEQEISRVDLNANGKTGFDAEFEESFWPAWQHNRVGPAAALRAFKAVRSAGAALEDIVEGAKRYQANKPEWQNWKAPANWLSGGHWADEPSKPDEKTETPASEPREWVNTKDPRWPQLNYPTITTNQHPGEEGNYVRVSDLRGLMPPIPEALNRTRPAA